MAEDKLKITDESLLKATSKMMVDILLSRNVSNEDIEAGIYKPISKTSSILNLEKLSIAQNTQPRNVKASRHIFPRKESQ